MNYLKIFHGNFYHRPPVLVMLLMSLSLNLILQCYSTNSTACICILFIYYYITQFIQQVKVLGQTLSHIIIHYLSCRLLLVYLILLAIELGRCGSKLQLTSDKGYLSLPTYTPASRQCTWTLLVNKTQHLSITVEPISNNASLLCTSSVQVNELQQMGRQTYGWHSITACPDGDSHYQSKSPGVRLDLSKSHHTRQEPLFLLRYRGKEIC